MKKIYAIDIDCAHCAALCEEAAAKVAGVSELSINFLAGKMTVVFDEGADEKAVLKGILKACRRIERDFDIKLR